MQQPPGPSSAQRWLHDTWTFYFHDADDPSWTLQSYSRLGTATTVEDMWDLHSGMRDKVPYGMFFVMRGDVFPCWDDAANVNGGCLSIKVHEAAATAAWELLLKRALGETLLEAPDAWASVTGVSISPKRGFCILKVWLGDDNHTERKDFRLPEDYDGAVVYRSNRENMRMDAERMSERTAEK